MTPSRHARARPVRGGRHARDARRVRPIAVLVTALCAPSLAVAGCASTGPAGGSPDAPLGLPAPPEVGPAPERPGPGRLPEGITPIAYDLELWVDPGQETFTGAVSVEVDVARPTALFWLHAGPKTEVRAAQCRAAGRTLGAHLEPATGPGAAPDAGERRLTCADRVPAGRARLDIAFSAPFDANLAGLYRARAGEGDDARWYAYTQFEAMDARRAFPCFDEPRFKTPFRVTVHAPSGMQVVGNASVVATEDADGLRTWRFAETPPLPTYLLALVVGDLDVVEHPGRVGRGGADGLGVPLRGVTVKGRGGQVGVALQMASEVLPLLEDYFGVPYPYDKLDLAALVEFSAGAMENAGLVTFREEALLVDAGTTPRSRIRGIASIITHELAHQWFGNLVTMPWWDDLWLNEAFATWMAARTVDAWRPEYDERTDLLGGKLWVFGEDVLADARAVRNPVRSLAEAEAAFDGLTYVKGAAVLSMVERWIGPDAFRAGLQAYMKRHAFGSATAADLWRALSEASGQDVTGVFSSFVDRAGAPLVTAHLVCAGATPTVTLSQSRYRPLGARAPEGFPTGGPWRIPVCVEWPDPAAPTATRTACTVLDGPSGSLRLDGASTCPAWLHPNADEAGYYRWTVAPEALRVLVAGQAALSRRARVGLPDQVWAAVAAGRLPPSEYLAVAEALAGTTDRHVAEQLTLAVARVRHTWEPLADTPGFRAWVGRVLGPSAARLGFAPREGEPEDDALLRPEVLGALARAGGAQWLDMEIAKAASAYLRDPKAVSADLAGMVLRHAAWSGAVAPDQIRPLVRAESPTVRVNALRALGALRQGRGLEEALELAVTEEVRAQDLRYILEPAWEGDAPERAAALEFVRRRWDGLTARLPKFGWGSAARLPERVGEFCDAPGRDAARALFEERRPEGGERHLALGMEKADQCIALRGSAQPELGG